MKGTDIPKFAGHDTLYRVIFTPAIDNRADNSCIDRRRRSPEPLINIHGAS